MNEAPEKVDLLIRDATVITQNARRQVIPNAGVAITGEHIAAVGPLEQVSPACRPTRIIEASGCYVFPGLINTHTHAFQTFMKGLGEGMPLYEWVDAVTAPSTVAMRNEQGYQSALLAGIEALHSGVTTVLDFMYSMPNTDLYRSVAKAFSELGIRAVLARGIMDYGQHHGLPTCQFHPVDQSLTEWDGLVGELAHPLFSFALAPEIPFGVSHRGLLALREYADQNQMLLTMHINENQQDDQAMLADYGRRTIPFLEDIGFLGPDLLAVHCVAMQPEDIEIFARNNVKVSHNPVSNAYLGVGIAPLKQMNNAGICLSLGTDGAASNNSQDMIETLKCTGLMQKLVHNSAAAIKAAEILDMATLGGAAAIGQAHRLGSLEAGKQADLFIMDPGRAKSAPVLDPIASLVYSCGQDNVRSTIVAGKVVMDEGCISSIDTAALYERCQSSALELAQRVGTHKLLPSFPIGT